MTSSAVLADGCVYFQCGGLYCLDAATGKLRWELWQEDWSDNSPAVADGFVYAVINKKVYCLNAKDGKEVWKIDLKDNISAPTVAEGNVYLWGDGELFSLNARRGDLLWKMNIEIQPLPIVAQGKVFITDKNKALCIDAKNGNIVWGNDFNYSYPARLAVSRGRFFVMADVLYCFNSASGKLEWKSDFGKRLTGIPLVSDSYLYVRSSDSRINCLNPVTGDKLWDIPAPAGRWTIADGNIFVSSTDYKIYCLKTPDR
jgi:outer membrane protein assembly factor BamB